MLDLHPTFANTMRFKPMDFSFSYRTIAETDRSDSLELSPVTFTVEADKPLKDVNAMA